MQTLNHTKAYQCICGKAFNNPQSFNGHKSHCEIHLFAKGGEQCLNMNKERQYKAAVEANIARKKIGAEKRENALTSWLAEKHACEKCGNIMLEKFGSGRFCSKMCAMSRVHSVDTKQKIKASLDETLISQNKAPSRNKKFCIVCGASIKSNNKTGFCRRCLENTDEGFAVKQKLGKLGYVAKQKRGTHKGWQSRNIISYAEQFWTQVLDNNNIEYQREVPVWHGTANYFLDFVIEHNDKLIDLEIDGKQHTYEDRVQSDVIRDLYLTKQGYLVYRVAWNEISSDEGAQVMKEKIDAFLNFYNTL